EIGPRAFLNRRSDLLHALSAGIRGQNGPCGDETIKQGQHAAGDDNPIGNLHFLEPRLLAKGSAIPRRKVGGPCQKKNGQATGRSFDSVTSARAGFAGASTDKLWGLSL